MKAQISKMGNRKKDAQKFTLAAFDFCHWSNPCHYCLCVTGIHMLIDLVYYVLAGLVWIYPAGKVISWLAAHES